MVVFYVVPLLNILDLLLTLGLKNKIENNIETIGLNCTELDRYSYV